jgi:hypothetical protein
LSSPVGAASPLPSGGLAATTGAGTPELGTTSGGPPFIGTLTQDLGTAGPAGADFSAGGGAIGPTSGSFTPTGGGGVGNNILSYIEKNPGLLLAGGGLGLSLMNRNQPIPGSQPVTSQANLLAQQGNQNISALQTGQLPAGAQSQIDNAANAAKASIRSQFARMGATGSTSEAQALAGVDQAAAATQFQDLKQVSDLGLSEINAATPLYQDLMRAQIGQDQATQDAIMRLAAALAGSRGAGTA